MSQSPKYRLGGILGILVGLFFSWWGIWLPLQDAQAGLPVIYFQTRAAILVPLAMVFGLFFLLFGDRYPYRDIERKTLTPTGWILFAIVAVAGLGTYFWVETTFSGLGYR
jgi:hypothetical protein